MRAMAGSWKVVPHTADLALAVKGDTLEDVLEAAALGLWSLGWDRRRVNPQRRWEIRAEGRDAEALLVNFLNELIFRHETDGVVWRDVERLTVEADDSGGLILRAVVRGEPFRPGHRLRREIKAATLHGLAILKKGKKLAAQVVLDL